MYRPGRSADRPGRPSLTSGRGGGARRFSGGYDLGTTTSCSTRDTACRDKFAACPTVEPAWLRPVRAGFDQPGVSTPGTQAGVRPEPRRADRNGPARFFLMGDDPELDPFCRPFGAWEVGDRLFPGLPPRAGQIPPLQGEPNRRLRHVPSDQDVCKRAVRRCEETVRPAILSGVTTVCRVGSSDPHLQVLSKLTFLVIWSVTLRG